MSRPSIPEEVKRELRQEANFGCALCGAPVIEYHHIIPYSESQHHDPDEMIILCPNHHTHAGPNTEALSQARLYELKANPCNTSIVDYEFYFKPEMPYIQIGGMQAKLIENDQMDVLTIDGQPLIGFSYIDNILYLNILLKDEEENVMAAISRNQWIARPQHIWDMEYKPNNFKIQHGSRDIGVEISYTSNSDYLDIKGRFYHNGEWVRFTPKYVRTSAGHNARMEGPQMIDTTDSVITLTTK